MDITKFRKFGLLAAGLPLLIPVIALSAGQDGTASKIPETQQRPAPTVEVSAPAVEHADCSFFGPERERLLRRFKAGPATSLTEAVLRRMTTAGGGAEPETDAPPPGDPFIPRGSRSGSLGQYESMGTIDANIFRALQDASVNPAPRTTDQEFLRRAALDLTGRIPDPARVVSFLNDADPAKRSKLVDELLAKGEWVDKWQMYFGDLYKNSILTVLGDQRFPAGRNAFHAWIRSSLQANKPYNQMAREIISVASRDNSLAESSYTKGEINWLTGARQMGGVPQQDLYDQMAANTFQTFLGISHLNCILCHDGRGHLNSLSLWGTNATRQEAWQISSFFARTQLTITRPDPADPNRFYYSLQDNLPGRPAGVPTDYTLNTTTGNRPPRTGNTTVPPKYIFSGRSPSSPTTYRTFYATEITGDLQFARATVNYIWKEFFGRGIVDPVDQFDPARLDPDNPPNAPWTLQPSNARLLNALAQDFINSNYDLKALMRQIVNSQTYQRSSRYYGSWNPSWEPLFARHMVRRLWAEEIHDALAQSSNIFPSYFVDRPPFQTGPFTFAMQLPETFNTGNATFLDSFLRGDRQDDQRGGEASLPQAMNLMNDAFVTARLATTGTSLLGRNLSLPDDQLITNLFLTVLSRYPSAGELALARTNLTSGNRTQEAQNLLWVLYNKVDFIYNY